MFRHQRIFSVFLLSLALPLGLSGCNDGTANLSLQLEKFSFERVEGLNRFTHNRVFQEHAGTGVTLNRGKVCIEHNKFCIEAEVNYRIDAKSTFRQTGHHFATPLEKDVVTLEYWGVDDANNDINIKMIVEIDGDEATIQ